MELNGSYLFRHRKIPSMDRFLGPYTKEPSQNITEDTNEFNEEDIFSTGDFSSESPNNREDISSSTTVSLSPCNHRDLHNDETFGILAALSDRKTDFHHHVHRKTPLSSASPSSKSSIPSVSAASSTSSSRLIPKPPQERVPVPISFSKYQRHSAPVNVPVLSAAMKRRNKEFDEIDEDDEEIDGEMLPPHEIVARTQSPMKACSVLEGVGRTLKGRDLRQVRNAVWRQTGFLD